jgi:hypothetical protein
VCSQPEIANIIRRIDYIDCPAIAAIASDACLLEPEERATLAEAGLALIHEWVRPELEDLHPRRAELEKLRKVRAWLRVSRRALSRLRRRQLDLYAGGRR